MKQKSINLKPEQNSNEPTITYEIFCSKCIKSLGIVKIKSSQSIRSIKCEQCGSSDNIIKIIDYKNRYSKDNPYPRNINN